MATVEHAPSTNQPWQLKYFCPNRFLLKLAIRKVAPSCTFDIINFMKNKKNLK